MNKEIKGFSPQVLVITSLLLLGALLAPEKTAAKNGCTWVPYEPTCAPSCDVPFAGTLPPGKYGPFESHRTCTRPQPGSYCAKIGGVEIGGGEVDYSGQ